MKKSSPNKTGTALIIALGFLALLTVMILAFAARTRTDRVASRSYLENARAGQLLHSAIAYAMEDIDTLFKTNYPDQLAFSSLGTASIAGSIDFSVEEDFLPFENDLILSDYSNALTTAQWIPISDNTNEIGRVAYIAVNTSGLLDANHVGSATENRRDGRSPKEIRLSPDILPELGQSGFFIDPYTGSQSPAPDAATAFAQNRDTLWNRFETLRDVAMLNDEKRGDVIIPPISAFNTFSLFPSNNPPTLELSEDIDENDFEAYLLNCGFDSDETEHIINNYFDYIDEDNIPRDLYGSSPEAVPMINEISIDVRYTLETIDPSNVAYQIEGELYLETWQPFDFVETEDGVIEIYAGSPGSSTSTNETGNVEFLNGDVLVDASPYITAVINYTNLSKAVVLELNDYTSDSSEDGLFTQYEFEFGIDETFFLETALFDNDLEPIAVRFLSEQIEIVIDETADLVENIEIDILTASDSGSDFVTYACHDSRVNSDFSDLELWSLSDEYTPLTPNTHDYWGEESGLDNKNEILFHCANEAMTNAAELGHLSTGKPWDTIRLYADGEDPDPVLDYFHTTDDPLPAATQPGLININSPHADVHATAFHAAPIINSTETIQPDQARILGENLAAMSTPDWKTRSFSGHALSNNVPDWDQLTDAQKDSIVGNTYRLYGTRDTSYTLLLVAQTGTDRNNDGQIDDTEIRATRQGVATIWRDPQTETAAITFFGLTETLRRGDDWDTLLGAFQP